MNKIFLTFAILYSSTLYSSDSQWSVSDQAMENYTIKCGNLPNSANMEKILRARIGARKTSAKPTGIIQKLANYAKDMLSEKIDYIEIDGFKLKKVSDLELALLLRLTTHSDSFNWLYEDDYEMEKTIINGTLHIKRKCKAKFCQKNANEGLSYIFDLNKVKNEGKICEDIICASKRIFGDPEGVYLLYALEKYGLQLSKYSDVNADPSGFDLETLKSILIAAEATPKHLREISLKNTTFYRFLKGRTLAINGPFTIANAGGAVYDLIEEYDTNRQIFIFSHEIGHRASGKKEDLDESPEWLAISGFQEIDNGKEYLKDYKKLELRKSISEYGDVSPFEDFSETYALYRFSPNDLKKKSMPRYNFMKNKVFEGIEYVNDICSGSKYQSTKAAPTPARGAR